MCRKSQHQHKNILDVLVKNKQTLPCLAEFSNAYCFLYLFFYYNKNVFCIKSIVIKKLSPEICQHGFFSMKWGEKSPPVLDT